MDSALSPPYPPLPSLAMDVTKLPVAQRLQFNMIHAHNTFKFGYEAIVRHLEEPPMSDLPNFLGYCHAWTEAVAHHHDSEEEVVFPFLNRKLDFSPEAEQHKVIHAHLDALCADLRAARADPAKFDATALKARMLDFREPLYSHLDEEVERIAPEHLSVFSEAELLQVDIDLMKYVKSHGDPFLNGPYMRSHTPPELKELWPPLPWVVRRLAIPYGLALRHSGYWKYAPYALA